MRAVDPKRLVRDGYDRIAEDYAAWREAGGVKARYLDRVRHLVPEGEPVLDLGCGTGEHVTRPLAGRHPVVGVDLSPHSIELARARVPEARYVVGDMATVAFRPGAFAAVTAFFSLIHVPREEHATVLVSTHRHLHPGGHLVATMSSGDGGDTTGDFFGAELFWSGWSRDRNLALLDECGFDVVSAQDETEEEHGEAITFLWVVARRR